MNATQSLLLRRWTPGLTMVCVLALVCFMMAGGAMPARGDEAADWRTVDAVFEEWNRWDSPGAALAVEREGKLIYARGYGAANLEYPIPITPSTPFHVASVSKQFTCFAIVLLAQEGKLSLDDDIRKHVPEVPNFGPTITIRHLIHHTSGLHNQWMLLAMAGWRLDDVITQEHILKMIERQKELNFEPGSEHLYSNTGYTILAEIVSKVSGQPFAAFCEERIFKPLGMTNTHFHDDHERIVPGRAYSYAKSGSGYKNSVLSFANVGATSLFSSAEDLARWLANLDDGRVGGLPAVKQMHERGQLTSGKALDYAFALAYSSHRGLQMVGHSGSDAGFRSHVLRVPKHKLGIVVLSNLASFNPTRAAHKVAEILLAEHLEPASEDAAPKSEAVQIDGKVLDRHVGVYQLENGPVVRLTRSGLALLAEMEGSPVLLLKPRSEKEFYVEEVEARVVFEQTGDEPSTAFTAQVGGEELRVTRVPPKSTADLSALAGDYYSGELDTTYHLALDHDTLVAHHQRNSDVTLRSLGGDEFAGNQFFFGSIRFERAADKSVTGFRVSSGRVRNLLFVRRASPN